MNSYPILSLGICSLPNSPVNLVDSAIKYRIGIHSEPIRTISIHSDICMQANANHFEPIWKTFCISFDENRLKIDPTLSDLIRGNYPNESVPIRINPTSESFWLILIENSVWINPSPDWFGLKTWFRIGSNSFGFLPRIK